MLDLQAIFGDDTPSASTDRPTAVANDRGTTIGVRQSAEGDGVIAPDVIQALRSTDTIWVDAGDVDRTDHSARIIDPPDPCPKCGSLELWESMAGDLFGLTPGRWRCLRCDPPAQSRRLCKRADRLRRSPRRNPNDKR